MSELTDRINKLKPLLEMRRYAGHDCMWEALAHTHALENSPKLLLELLQEHEKALGELSELRTFYKNFQAGIAEQAEARRKKFKRIYVKERSDES